MVSKYDGIDDDSTRISRLSHRGIQETPRIDLGYWGGFSCINRVFWCNWILLPWDQIGYWAVKIVTGVPEAIPLVGSSLVELLRGSVSVGQSTLTRFYSLHTFVLPLLTAVSTPMHFSMIRKQGISGPL